MKISILAENNVLSDSFQSEHGLSMLIEAEGRSILFDMGASDIFCANAAAMSIDLSGVDLAVLSHGHYDHGGGLAAFLAGNGHAPVYVSKHVFGDYRLRQEDSETLYIGIDPTFAESDRFRFADGRLDLAADAILFSGVSGDYPRPSGNSRLLMGTEGDYLPDDFHHEQNLLLTCGGKRVLFAGCAHSGIVNILDHCRSLCGAYPDVVLGGFHLIDRGTDPKDLAELNALAGRLLESGAMFYTCHCTGLPAYEHLRRVMGERIEYLACGAQLTLP